MRMPKWPESRCRVCPLLFPLLTAVRLKAFLNSPFLLCLYLSSPLCQHFSLFPSPSKSLLSLPSDSPFQLCLYPSFPFPPCLYLSTPSLSISLHSFPLPLSLYLSLPSLRTPHQASLLHWWRQDGRKEKKWGEGCWYSLPYCCTVICVSMNIFSSLFLWLQLVLTPYLIR